MPHPGLRGKLAISIALVLLIALGVTYFAVYRGTGSELKDRTESELDKGVSQIAARLKVGGADTPAEHTARAHQITSAEGFGPNARLVSISIEGGGTASNQPELVGPGLEDHHSDGEQKHAGHESGDDSEDEPAEKKQDADRILGSAPGYSTIEVEDAGKVRILTREVELPGGVKATIRVGQPLAPAENALEGLSDTFVIVGIATLLLGALAGWLLASTATRPMRRMAQVAEGVDAGDLSARMPVEGTRDEARRLAESFNGMLDRLEDAFDRQRAFVADASHDLRTPLTVVRGQAEVLARNPNPSREEVTRVYELVSQATARMELMVDDLLLLARAESSEGLRLEPLELEPLISAEVEGMAFENNRDLVAGVVTGRRVNIDREQVARLLSNLISNAIAHTEEGGRIEVSATDHGSKVVLAVDDDGPGVPESDRERVFDRFARLDESRSSSLGGSGLGLAIVRAIAEAHGGEARCVDSPLGGARFEIGFPAA
ncbi:MAG TPA: ATP-binding protein [Solirubrobacterales bacterium]|nr:ATP-binding protein [Solirubrobacterales bacterium]HMY25710.1 ATP-binding protein [Solirubrobacterales bacterium]HNA43824.1 ATP-binding protein [Solirubrobacterales bacterium]HNC14612.1 ATP-binding protein [Solirubrobacterales bacterium]HNE77721.1 ATP-binding protein [Solirubrobacterales bacterium]